MIHQIKHLDLTSKHLHLPARFLMSVLFLVSGFGKLQNVEATQKYMEAYGVPGFLLVPAAAFEIGGGTALLMGWRTRTWAMLLAPWCLLTAAIFHTDWKDQEQRINLMKNMAMAGGFMVLADHGLNLPSCTARVERNSDRLVGAPQWSIRIHLTSAENEQEHCLPLMKH